MCVACGNIPSADSATTLLTFIIAFSPLMGLYAYRIYVAVSIKYHVRHPKNTWLLALRLGIYSMVVYGLCAALAHAAIAFTAYWTVATLVTPILLLLTEMIYAWIIAKNQSLFTSGDFVRIGIGQGAAFLLICIASFILYSQQSSPLSAIEYHRWFVYFGMVISTNSALLAPIVFVSVSQLLKRHYADAAQSEQRPMNSKE